VNWQNSSNTDSSFDIHKKYSTADLKVRPGHAEAQLESLRFKNSSTGKVGDFLCSIHFSGRIGNSG
jgi:hypothetical protein